VNKLKAGAVILVVAALAFGVLTAYPRLWWGVVGALVWWGWREERKLKKINIPAPPAPPPPLVNKDTQVKEIGNGAGCIVYPPGHVRRYDV